MKNNKQIFTHATKKDKKQEINTCNNFVFFLDFADG